MAGSLISQDAIAFYLEALKISPYDEKSLLRLGEIYFRAKKYEPAKEYFQKGPPILETFFSSNFPHIPPDVLFISSWLSSLSSFDLALGFDHHPLNVKFAERLGDVHFKEKRFDLAATTYIAGLSRATSAEERHLLNTRIGSCPSALIFVGEVYYAAGHVADGVKLLQEVLKETKEGERHFFFLIFRIFWSFTCVRPSFDEIRKVSRWCHSSLP